MRVFITGTVDFIGFHRAWLQRLTGYRLQTPFKKGVAAFVQWYRDQYIGQ